VKFWIGLITVVIAYLIQQGIIKVDGVESLAGAFNGDTIRNTLLVAMSAFLGVTVYSPVARDKAYGWLDEKLQPKPVTPAPQPPTADEIAAAMLKLQQK